MKITYLNIALMILFFPILICLFSIVCVRNKIFAFGFNIEILPYPSVLHDKKDWFTNNSNNFVHNWYIYISDLYITSSIWLLT